MSCPKLVVQFEGDGILVGHTFHLYPPCKFSAGCCCKGCHSIKAIFSSKEWLSDASFVLIFSAYCRRKTSLSSNRPRQSNWSTRSWTSHTRSSPGLRPHRMCQCGTRESRSPHPHGVHQAHCRRQLQVGKKDLLQSSLLERSWSRLR